MTEVADNARRIRGRHMALAALGGLTPALILGGLIATGEPGERPPFLSAAPKAARTQGTEPPGDTIEAAGSGANVPLTRLLAERFAAGGGTPLVVHASIGSRGGILAAADGAVALGLVSRPLGSKEAALGLDVVPYARAEVVLAAHPDTPEEALGPDDVLAIYRGERATWRDGTPITVFLREVGDSGQEALARALPGFGEAIAEAHRTRRFRVLYRERDMEESLRATPGAIGVFDTGLAATDISSDGASLRLIRVTGVVATRDLAFVHRVGDTRAAAFLAFVRSPAGREVIADRHYLPLAPPGTGAP